MKINKPWGINRIGDMVSAHVRTQRGGKWVCAVPTPYHKNIRESIRAAWWVFTGRAEAVIWPEAGDLEAAIDTAQDVAGLESRPETLRLYCQTVLDIIDNYNISHDACEEDIALLNDIRDAVDPATKEGCQRGSW